MSSGPASDFPAIYELATQTRHPLRHVDVFLVGRHPTADWVLLDVTCSRNQFRIVRQSGRLVLEPLSATVPTRCDGQAAAGPVVLRHEMLIEAGGSRFQFLEHPPSLESPGPPTPPVVPLPPPPIRSCPLPMRTIVGPGASSSEDVAMVRGALLPQIILAGVIAPVEGVAKLLAQLFSSAYWGYRALAALLPEEVSTCLGADDWSAGAALGVLLVHVAAFIAGAVGVLIVGDPNTRRSAATALRKWSAGQNRSDSAGFTDSGGSRCR